MQSSIVSGMASRLATRDRKELSLPRFGSVRVLGIARFDSDSVRVLLLLINQNRVRVRFGFLTIVWFSSVPFLMYWFCFYRTKLCLHGICCRRVSVYRLSVNSSVCPFVCLSQAGTVPK